MVDTAEALEKFICVGVSSGDTDMEETQNSLDELELLIETAGAVVVEKVIQNRERPHPGTYIGPGKIDEVRERMEELGATGVVCDDELSPAQLRNLEELLDTKILDRTQVILDIFAGRAATREGQLQVEMAQLKYRSSRLAGTSTLSRLGGGIGTRGPGETKLETDRRVIRSRIAQLNRDLDDIKRHREVTRAGRSRSGIPVTAIVGYTNAGKSTLLNALTEAGILAEDKLFATLDPTTRSLALPGGEEILLTDTVGFISKLPHHLIQAFRSTLEEAKYADIILHVVDAGNPQMERQMDVVYQTLKELGVQDKTIVTLFNKMDRLDIPVHLKDSRADETLYISAKTGQGLDELRMKLSDILRSRKLYIERTFPYAETGKIQAIRRYGQLLSEDYQDDGIHVTGYLPAEYMGQI